MQAHERDSGGSVAPRSVSQKELQKALRRMGGDQSDLRAGCGGKGSGAAAGCPRIGHLPTHAGGDSAAATGRQRHRR